MRWKEGEGEINIQALTACIPKLCEVGTAMGPLRLPVGLLTSLAKGSLTCKGEIYVKNISILK